MSSTPKKRGRWLYVILLFIVVAFAAASVIPLFGNLSAERLPGQSEPDTADDALSPEQRSELEATAKGYELVLQREPDNRVALEGLLEARLQLEDLDGAIAALERLADVEPERVEYRLLLAQAKQQQGDLEGATAAYRQALEQRPGDLNALRGLVGLLLSTDRPEAAIGELEQAIALGQDNEDIDVVSLRLLLAEVQFRRGRYDEAISVYDGLIASHAEDFRPVFGKALALRRQGKEEEAAALFDRAFALAPPEYKDQVKRVSEQLTLTPPPPEAGEATEAPQESQTE